MIKRLTIYTGMMLLASSAAASYDHCLSQPHGQSDQVCQAYLAGIEKVKSTEKQSTLLARQDSFRERALEQRVGSRYKKSVMSTTQ